MRSAPPSSLTSPSVLPKLSLPHLLSLSAQVLQAMERLQQLYGTKINKDNELVVSSDSHRVRPLNLNLESLYSKTCMP